jgi:hypothetical protein
MQPTVPKKQKMIGDDGDDYGDDGDDDNANDSSSSTNDDNYLSELEEEMNLPTGSEDELLIRQGRSNDGDTSDDDDESQYFSDD